MGKYYASGEGIMFHRIANWNFYAYFYITKEFWELVEVLFIANWGIARNQEDHKLNRLIEEDNYKKYLYVGPQALLFIMRQKLWPLNGRNLKKIVHNCLICFKTKPITHQQLMSNFSP